MGVSAQATTSDPNSILVIHFTLAPFMLLEVISSPQGSPMTALHHHEIQKTESVWEEGTEKCRLC